jgi:hypothetical protein
MEIYNSINNRLYTYHWLNKFSLQEDCPSNKSSYKNYFAACFGRFAPYLERDCILLATP